VFFCYRSLNHRSLYRNDEMHPGNRRVAFDGCEGMADGARSRYAEPRAIRRPPEPDVQLTFDLDSPEVRALSEADPRLDELARAAGPVGVDNDHDMFVSLARAITGQQLSTKAAATIWGRLVDGGLTSPEAVLSAGPDELRLRGLSRAKAAYLADLAAHVLDGRLAEAAIGSLDDDAVVAEVTRVKGIGRWTAEMFLIFSLGRLDVLALDDAGLLRAAGWLLDLGGRSATAMELAEAGEAWRPYRSVASLYLWAALDRGLVPR
jgi:DNA-3-methyladenine glycosylase II